MKNYLIPQIVQRELLLPNRAEPSRRVEGGLSAAQVYYCLSPGGPLALRAWPAAHPSPTRLAQIHRAMISATSAGLNFIPRIFASHNNATFVHDGQRLWELTEWMPGAADYVSAPSDGKLRSGVQALARLHRVWASESPGKQPSPTCRDRIQRLEAWCNRDTIAEASPNELERSLTEDTLRALDQFGPALLRELRRYSIQPVKVHFALRDIRDEHLLFTAERVSGIIDFGAGRIDEPATDLARLLGSLEPFDRHRRQLGINYYLEVNPHIDPARVELLDRVGTLLSAAQWLQWLVIERREFAPQRDVLWSRWRHVLGRIADL